MSADRLINLLVTIAIIQMMISVGLGVTLADIGAVATDWHLLIHAAVANYVCVPAVVIGLLLCSARCPWLLWDSSSWMLDQFTKIRIEADNLAAQLLAEGVKAFVSSWNELLECINTKTARVRSAS
jgi:hypothetical protein